MLRCLFLVGLTLLTFGALPLTAEVEVLNFNDGEIVLGTLKSLSADGAHYEVFGKERVVQISLLLRSSKRLDTLAGKKVEVLLLDGNRIEGSITDYTPEVGLFVDLDSIGTLMVPTATIQGIYDPERRKVFSGSAFQIDAIGRYYWPLNPSFGPFWDAAVRLQAKGPLIRGLYWGVDLDYAPLNYLGSALLTYKIYQLTPIVVYQFFTFRTDPGLLSIVVPYVSLGTGVSFLTAADGQPGNHQNNYGSVVPHGMAEAGLQLKVPGGAGITISERVMSILQNDDDFTSVGSSLSLTLEF